MANAPGQLVEITRILDQYYVQPSIPNGFAVALMSHRGRELRRR
ncbi:MAG: hypothetical protein ACTSWP_12270 [Candidatus Freyarchaeota archaeon]|nr:hypothetical protein [Candidatus Freyrarchaeum guaymaensis]